MGYEDFRGDRRMKNSFKNLYIKDLKSIYIPFLVLFVFFTGYIFFVLDISIFKNLPISRSFVDNSHFEQYLGLILYTSIIIFPCIFLFSWSLEEKNKTHYQLYLIPGSFQAIIKSKLFAVLTMGMIWSIGIAVFVLLMETMRSHNTAYYSENNSFYWLVMTFTVYVRVIGNLLVCMGISSVVIGLTQRIRRY